MKKSLLIAALLALCSIASVSFAGKKDVDSSMKADHQMTVGNDKAAASGSTSEDKTVKEEKTHTNQGKSHDKKK